MSPNKDFVRSRYWPVFPALLLTGLFAAAVTAPPPPAMTSEQEKDATAQKICNDIRPAVAMQSKPLQPIWINPARNPNNGDPACAVRLSDHLTILVGSDANPRDLTSLMQVAP